tara:strand:- start:3309 stop:3599 length:291 start_codon:yes stop_codon:yes gene_type:complete
MKTIKVNDRWSFTTDAGAIRLTQTKRVTATSRSKSREVGEEYQEEFHTWHNGYKQVANKMLNEDAAEDAKTIEEMSTKLEEATTSLEKYLSSVSIT